MAKKPALAGSVLVFILVSTVFALQPPGNEPYVISFQGKLEGVEGPVDLTFNIYDVVSGGTPLWTETHTGIPLDRGIFDVKLGSINPLGAGLFTADRRYLGVTIGTDPELTPRPDFTAAPYAFVARSVKGGRVEAEATGHAIKGVSTVNGDGVQGYASSSNLRSGVYGYHPAGGYGMYARAQSGTGVLGESMSGDKPGVYGKSEGHAVVGRSSVDGDGVQGYASSSNLRSGMYGYHPAGGYGVYGRAQSGTGVLGESMSGNNPGVYATGNPGLYARDRDNTALRGEIGKFFVEEIDGVGFNRWYGVFGTVDVDNYGVLGHKTNETPSSVLAQKGVYGISKTDVTDPTLSVGVYGESVYGYGVHGKGKVAGVYGASDGYGIYGYSSGSLGIHGESDDGVGVNAYSTNGVGLQCGTGKADGKWGLYTEDKAYAGYGYHTSLNGSYFAPGTDMAEWIGNIKRQVEAGDIVVADPDNARSVVKSARAHDPSVVGIISTQPGYLGGEALKDELGEDKVTKLALAGVVPCKVSAENGPIRIGDLLVTSNTPGHAMRDVDPKNGTIVGKSLEALPAGTGKILVLVTLQ